MQVMCFTPFVSISIAITEYVLATILLLRFKKTALRDYFALLIYVLGTYQFNEFMLCTTDYGIFFAKLGIIIYTFLPAIALHGILKIYHKISKAIWIYVIPVLTSLLVIINTNFIVSAKCTTVFVEVSTIFKQQTTYIQNIPYWIYVIYYFGFIILSMGVILKDNLTQKNKIKRQINLAIVLGIAAMVVPTFIFIVLFPFLSVRFPSVLCGFAIFAAIATFIAAYLESKVSKK
jgi:hypothetical protein